MQFSKEQMDAIKDGLEIAIDYRTQEFDTLKEAVKSPDNAPQRLQLEQMAIQRGQDVRRFGAVLDYIRNKLKPEPEPRSIKLWARMFFCEEHSESIKLSGRADPLEEEDYGCCSVEDCEASAVFKLSCFMSPSLPITEHGVRSSK